MNVTAPLAAMPVFAVALVVAPYQPGNAFDLVIEMIPKNSEPERPAAGFEVFDAQQSEPLALVDSGDLAALEIPVEQQASAFVTYLQNISAETSNPESGPDIGARDTGAHDTSDDKVDADPIEAHLPEIFSAPVAIQNAIEIRPQLIVADEKNTGNSGGLDVPRTITDLPLQTKPGLNPDKSSIKIDAGIARLITNFVPVHSKAVEAAQAPDEIDVLTALPQQVISTTAQEILSVLAPGNQNISSQLLATTPSFQIDKQGTTDPMLFAERYLDLARDNRWLDSLARDIVAAATDQDRLSFRLRPDNLGRLDIDLAQMGGDLSVKITASTDDAAKIVAAAQPRLFEELRAQGLRVSGGDVATSNHQQFGQSASGQSLSSRKAEPIEHSAFSEEDNDPPKTTRPAGRFA
jgi:flagellar hook-length control protein FliK